MSCYAHPSAAFIPFSPFSIHHRYLFAGVLYLLVHGLWLSFCSRPLPDRCTQSYILTSAWSILNALEIKKRPLAFFRESLRASSRPVCLLITLRMVPSAGALGKCGASSNADLRLHWPDVVFSENP